MGSSLSIGLIGVPAWETLKLPKGTVAIGAYLGDWGLLRSLGFGGLSYSGGSYQPYDNYWKRNSHTFQEGFRPPAPDSKYGPQLVETTRLLLQVPNSEGLVPKPYPEWFLGPGSLNIVYLKQPELSYHNSEAYLFDVSIPMMVA